MMASPEITYIIHIATTPEKLWEALTTPEALRKNWGRIESKWTVGSKVTEVDEAGSVLWSGRVLRSEPPRVLSFTFGEAEGIEPTDVTFELTKPASPVTPGSSVVRLVVTHSGFGANSKMMSGCARAWTEIMSSVKSYVETGRSLGFAWKH
jgi:uncharacterized protein YndB with AHSA1/START domain